MKLGYVYIRKDPYEISIFILPNVLDSKDIERDGAAFSSFGFLSFAGASTEFSSANFVLFACSHLSNHSFCKIRDSNNIPS